MGRKKRIVIAFVVLSTVLGLFLLTIKDSSTSRSKLDEWKDFLSSSSIFGMHFNSSSQRATLHVKRKLKVPLNCAHMVDERNIEEIGKADLFTRLYREYRDKRGHSEQVISKALLDDLMMIPDKNYIFDQSKCDEFIVTRGYNNYSISDEEITFPLAFSMVTHEHAEQFERLLRVIYRPQNAYCIFVDAKSDETFQRAVKSIVQCFPNVFVSTTRADVHQGDTTRLKADLYCMRDFLMASPNDKLPDNAKSSANMTKFWSHENMKDKKFRTDWKYLLNIASTEFPAKTNRELVHILNLYNGTNDIEYIYSWDQDRVKYHHLLNKNLGIRQRTGKLKSSPPFDLKILQGLTYGAFSHAFVEHVSNSIEARALLDWLADTFVADEFFWTTLQFSSRVKAPGGFQVDLPKENVIHMSRFMGLESRYQCDKAGQRKHGLCMLTNGDLHYVTSLPYFIINKFKLIDDPVAYACMEDWYARRIAQEEEHAEQHGANHILDLTPYCIYLHKISGGKYYEGCAEMISKHPFSIMLYNALRTGMFY